MTKKILSKNYQGAQAYFYIRPQIENYYCDEDILSEIRIKNYYNLGSFQKDDIVIDIGGHIGFFAVECAIRGASVLTFEPDEENYNMLLKNILVNDLASKITSYMKAVSSRGGKINLYLDSNNPGSHSIYKKYIDWDIRDTILVDSITLNDITKKLNQIALLKLDCEGAEYEILFDSDLSKIKKIVAELHNIKKNIELVEHLRNLGYKVNWHSDRKFGKLQAEK